MKRYENNADEFEKACVHAKKGIRVFLAKIEISQVVHNLYETHMVVQYEDAFPFLLREIELGIYFMNIQ